MNKNRKILSPKDISSKITRIAHEIIEHHNDLSNLVLLGIHNRGVPIASRLRKLIQDFTDIKIQIGSLDITFHRDVMILEKDLLCLKLKALTFNLI